ncbi:MAG: lytic transglycosylase domain-containing protein, partial [Thermodesulfobacteriota bacterium]
AVWAQSDPGLSLGDLWAERGRLMAAAGPEPAPPAVKNAWPRLRDLAGAGVLDLAQDEAEAWRAAIKGLPLKDLDLRLFAFLSAYKAHVGDYAGWVRLQYGNFGLLVRGRPDEQKILAQRRFFPLAFPGPVLEAAEEFQLHPALLLSVIRTESYYQPDVLSAANARGLMQLLPSTGQKISHRLGAVLPHPALLFSPETNIRFGACYLSALIQEFGGQLPLAIASYNAGPFNVKRWVLQAGDCTLEEFIEMIPFEQTNAYVKKILGAMYQHRLLFSSRSHCPNLDAPLRPVFLDEINF